MSEPTSETAGTPDVAVVAAGTIGISWTALFLAHGARVRVFDTRPGLKEYVDASLEQIAPTLAAIGLPTASLSDRLEITTSVEEAVHGADVIQENGPENLTIKQELLATIERAAAPDALILSSTSSMPATPMAAKLAHPERLLVGHPFNPPHLIPLVEVAPGERTSPEATQRAVDFYRQMGKHPVVIHKEIDGFVANRLQAALFREAVYLVEEGVVDVSELDEIVTSSIGPRWAGEGPFLSFHLGGGAGGLPAFFEHLGPALEGLWKELGSPTLDAATVKLVTDQAAHSFGGTPMTELEHERDRTQLAVLRAVETSNGTDASNGAGGRP